eukprot:9794656-Lingulodinium_polyedra.AAC.1
MPPRKAEAALLQDLRVHREWVEANLEVLRSRAGDGLQGKLRQLQGPEEQALYMVGQAWGQMRGVPSRYAE